MTIRVYDSLDDIRNLEITPEIRTRFTYLEPHEVHVRHSHDLGHEVFIVLDGLAGVEIDGEQCELGPGQFCFVRANQMHQVRNLLDVPLTMYLSVTPHIEPTHTMWSEAGEKLPPRYGNSTAKERAALTAPMPPVAELADRQMAALRQLEESVRGATEAQAGLLTEITKAVPGSDGAAGDPALKVSLDALWSALYPVFRDISAMAAAWNDLAVRVAPAP